MSGLAAGGSGYIVGLLSVTKTANRQVTRQVPPREAAPIGLYLLRKTCWRSSRFARRTRHHVTRQGGTPRAVGDGRRKTELTARSLFERPSYFLPLEEDASPA